MFLNLKPSSRIALKDVSGKTLTYSELINDINRLAPVLGARSLAFCMCRNVVACAVGYLSMVDSGIVPVMLSSSMNQELFWNLYVEYQPRLIWAPVEYRNRYQNWKILLQYDEYALFESQFDLYGLNDSLELCMSTSGSTGSPKLVRYKKGNLEANAKNVAIAFEWNEDERAFADLGLQYTMGLNVVNTHLYSGATVLLCDRNPMESTYWDFMREEQATNVTGVPFTFEIFARLRFFEMDLPCLTTIAEGGGRLSDKRFAELANFASSTGRRFFATFGTTETAARLAYLDPSLATEKTGSIGGPIPAGELYLIDGEGNILPDGVAEGELCYTGPNVTMGYAVSRSDLLKGDEWLGRYRTGDLARRDEDGCYYITGRLSRFLKLLGHRVSLDQCERIVSEKLGVACACKGTDSKMIIYAEADETRCAEVISVLSRTLALRLSLFECVPVRSLPRNESGKIIYSAL